jgi:hypothetical protein
MCVAEILSSSSLRKTDDNDIARPSKFFVEGSTREAEI